MNGQIDIWHAWWTGDTDALETIYGGAERADSTGFFASEAGGFRVTARGLFARARRWFWSEGTRDQGKGNRSRVHHPLAGDIALTSAGLLFADPPRLSADPDGPGGEQASARAQERLDLFWSDNTHATLIEAAEIDAALGGVYLRLVWGPDREVPWLTTIQPQAAVPEWRWGRLSSVTFWRELGRKGRTVWRHLERHEPGVVLHGLYEGTGDELGHPVPLTDHADTAGLAGQLTDGNRIVTGTDRLTATYVPNSLPNRAWRGVPGTAHLGRPDIGGIEQMLDAHDLVWSSLVRDVDLSRARLVVPREYLRARGPGQGATFPLDQEIYEGINVMATESGDRLQIELFQPEIRVEQLRSVIEVFRRAIIGSAGYALGTFGSDDDGQAVTASEIAARNRQSLVTRARKIRYWRDRLTEILETWTHIDAVQYGSGVPPYRPVLEWPDAVGVDELQRAQTLRELHTAVAASTEEKVRVLHPGWDDERVGDEVRKIREESGTSVDVDAALGTLSGNNPGAVA